MQLNKCDRINPCKSLKCKDLYVYAKYKLNKMSFKLNQVHTACFYLPALIVRVLISVPISGLLTFFYRPGILFLVLW